MQIEILLEKLGGVQTIESVMSLLKVNHTRAVYLIHRLREAGYVKTKRAHNLKRIYYISRENLQGGKNYYEIINEYSPIKIAVPEIHKIYGRTVTLEETLVFAIKTKKIRVILASISLFKKIKDWKLLYRLSKQNRMERKIGAIYDLARTIMRTKRMDGRIRRHFLPRGHEKYQYMVDGFESKDYMEIEKIWKVYLPFNKIDLGDYL